MVKSLIATYVGKIISKDKIITSTSYSPSESTFITSINSFLINNIYPIFEKAKEKFFLINLIDIKSLIIFIFILVLVVFPGYSSSSTGGSFLLGNALSSTLTQSRSQLGRLAFITSFSVLLIILIGNLSKLQKIKLTRFDFLILLFFISLEVSTLFSTYIDISFIWLRQAGQSFLLYFVFSRLNLSKKNLIIICLAFLSIIYFEFFLGILQFINQSLIGIPIETAATATTTNQLYLPINGASVFRPTGTLGQGNALSYIIAIAAPIAGVLIFNKNRLLKTFSIISIVICAVTSLISLSRWGTLSLFFSLFVFFVLIYMFKVKSIKPRRLLTLFLVFLTTILILFLMSNNLFARFLSYSSSDTSFQNRIQLINQAIYVSTHNLLFGIGGGTFTQYLINYDFTYLKVSTIFPAPVHNFYLLIFAENGIFPIFFFCFLIIYFIWFFLTHINFEKDKFIKLFLIGIFASTLTILFNGLWELRLLDQRITSGILFMNIGICFSLMSRHFKHKT